MYKVSIENNKIILQLNLARGKKSLMKMISARYSTGSPFTFTNAELIDHSLSEKDVDLNEGRAIRISGEVNSLAVYYPCEVNLAIGNIALSRQKIWVTFDRAAWDSIVGMDILSQVPNMYIPTTKTEFFFSSEDELIDFAKQYRND